MTPVAFTIEREIDGALMTGDLQGNYDPKAVEARWYPIWEEAGAFRPEVNPDGEPFTIVIPPPNVTGVLHMGHALDHSIQDALIRRKRMQGYAALWLPGTDHAGIATQMVVERELAVEGISRHDIGRERFVDQIWEWKRKSGGTITAQMRALGNSCDWSRERFTLDDGLSKAVREVFVRLYEKGLIYRGYRIINWSPGLMTAISDIEVEYRDTLGELVHITYPLLDGTGSVTVATTRAESMLGDTGVAVHPGDERYADLVGKMVRLPLMDREIPIVADEAVDPEFGTGAVKVTPAHDPIDFEIAGRADLPPIQVIGEDATMTEAAGRFAGLDRFAAREAVKVALEEGGFLAGVEPHQHSVAYCSRSGSVIEPLLSHQWFVKVDELVGPAMDVIRDGTSRFIPKRWEKNYFHWMENLHDWCISRQLWWGHRIPAWYCDTDGTVMVASEPPSRCEACGSPNMRPDEDVLDTWFSSALWPFSTLGWPDETDDLARYYPTTVMVTGLDIIFFWVARMLKMGIEFTGESPFEDIMIHGLVRTTDGQKMSKSLNNAVDPLELIEKYGADALRLSLLQSAAPGHDVPFVEEWVDATRRFGNKLWNAVKLALIHVEPGSVPAEGGYPENPTVVDRWILSRLADVGSSVDALFDDYRLSDAFATLYSFTWAEAFDWYLEMAKPTLAAGGPEADSTRQTLGVLLRDILKYFHPAIPFVTEELFSHLVSDALLITSTWPQVPSYVAPSGMATLQELIVGIRRFRAEHGLSPRHQLAVTIHDPDDLWADWWDPQLRSLAAVEPSVGAKPADSGYSQVVAGSVQAFIALEGLIDKEAERARLEKRRHESAADLSLARQKLANPKFKDRAPAEVVAKEERKASEATALIKKLDAQLAELG